MIGRSTYKVFFRQLIKNRRTSIINLIGLSIGLACSFIILLFVIGEADYERFQENRDQVYRILNRDNGDGSDHLLAINFGALSDVIQDEIPEIENSSVLNPRIDRPFYIVSDEEYIVETGTIYEVDPGYFDIFTVPLLSGNQDKPLSRPDHILISEEKGRKYFGNDDPVGETLTLIIDEEQIPYTIAGVLKSLPGNTSFEPDFIVPFNPRRHETIFGWKYIAFEIFIKIKEGSDIKSIETKINQIADKYVDKNEDEKEFSLQCLTDIRLESNHIYASHLSKGNKRSIVIFSIIALVILMIASINYILLTTAESSLRFKEVGIRKVLGAKRSSLILQIQLEALIKVFIALPIALFIVERTKGIVESFFGQELLPSYANNIAYIVGFVLITLLLGLISGLYLSISLSKLKPTELIFKQKAKNRGLALARKLMIGFQLTIFVILFSSMLIMRNQIRYAESLNGGLKIDKVYEISNLYREIENTDIFKTKLEAYPEIQSVTTAFSSLLDRNQGRNMAHSHKDVDNEIVVEQYFLDFNYVETVGIEISQGDGLKEVGATSVNEILVNQKMKERLNIDNPIGEIIVTRTMFSRENKEYTIVGVVNDFFGGSAHDEIGPLIIFPRPVFIPSRQILIQTKAGMDVKVYDLISSVYAALSNDKPMTIRSLLEKQEQLYIKENLLTRIISAIAYLAIFISSLGLFGLSLFVARSRNKEIGIRKVFGAGKTHIVRLIINEFIPIVVAANLVAIPVTIYIMKSWLNSFAYKASISPIIFILALLGSVLIVGLTLISNAHIAANADPIKTLRQE